MKKVLFITGTKVLSGAENVNLTIINNLKEEYEFYYVAKEGPIEEDLKENNIKYIKIKNFNLKEIRSIIKTIKPDIIHTQDYKASFLAAFAKEKKSKLIIHLHINPSWLKKVNLKSLFLLYAGIKANKILTVSNSIEREYIFSKKLKNKIMYLPNSIDSTRILSSVNGTSKKEYDICCVGRISEQKNPFKFIDIIAELSKSNENIKCVWVGDGNLKNQSINYAIDKGVSNNIEFVGFQKNPYKYMAKSKIFLLTSEREGYPMVLLEALTLGLPCVVSDVGGIPDIVTDECGKLCTNLNDYIEEINLLLKDKNIYGEKTKNAIYQSGELMNIEKYIKKIKDIYEE